MTKPLKEERHRFQSEGNLNKLHRKKEIFKSALQLLSSPGPSPSPSPCPNRTPSRIKVPPKKKKEGFGPWADTKITWATIHPTHPTHPITLMHEGVLW